MRGHHRRWVTGSDHPVTTRCRQGGGCAKMGKKKKKRMNEMKKNGKCKFLLLKFTLYLL